jgi:hypothetical protein
LKKNALCYHWRFFVNSGAGGIHFQTLSRPATDDDTLLPFSLPSICQKKVTVAFDGGLILNPAIGRM